MFAQILATMSAIVRQQRLRLLQRLRNRRLRRIPDSVFVLAAVIVFFWLIPGVSGKEPICSEQITCGDCVKFDCAFTITTKEVGCFEKAHFFDQRVKARVVSAKYCKMLPVQTRSLPSSSPASTTTTTKERVVLTTSSTNNSTTARNDPMTVETSTTLPASSLSTTTTEQVVLTTSTTTTTSTTPTSKFDLMSTKTPINQAEEITFGTSQNPEKLVTASTEATETIPEILTEQVENNPIMNRVEKARIFEITKDNVLKFQLMKRVCEEHLIFRRRRQIQKGILWTRQAYKRALKKCLKAF